MDFTKEIFGGVAVVIGLIGYIFYIRGIVEGKIKPHAFTWFVWCILTATAFFAQIISGGGPGSWVTGFTAVMSLGFVFVGLHSSSRVYIAKSDSIFFVGAILALPVWYLSGSPLWSVVVITIIDAMAFAPTFRKAYFHPETENMPTYLLSGIKFIFSLIALETFSITTALYPASLVIANLTFTIMLVLRKRTRI